MRDILDLIDSNIIIESRGIYARTPNDPPFSALAGNMFGARSGDLYYFQSVTSYPELGGFATAEKTQAAVDALEKKLNQKIIFFNRIGKGYRGFGVAEFLSANNNPIYFGKFFRSIEPSMMRKWGNSEIPGLQAELTGSKKARLGFKSQDILGTQNTFESGSQLLSFINASSTLPDNIKDGISMIGKNQLPVFVGEGENLAAIRDNLGELIQSLALTQGMVGGAADKAREQLLKNTPWQSLNIHFPSGKTFGLVDFYLRKGNLSLGVSSKGNKGAPASVRNLLDGIANAKAAGQDLEAEYPYATNIIKSISTLTQINGPLNLAVDFKLIDSSQANTIQQMIKQHVTKNPPEWTKKWLSKYKAGKAPGWNYGYWVLAALTAEIARIANADKAFSKGCLAILNYSSVIQMYTMAKKTGSDVAITKFGIIYPAIFKGTVVLNAKKSYYASGITQKFTFDFAPDNAVITPEPENTGINATDDIDVTGGELDYEPSRSDLKASDTVTTKPSRTSEIKTFGRARQRR